MKPRWQQLVALILAAAPWVGGSVAWAQDGHPPGSPLISAYETLVTGGRQYRRDAPGEPLVDFGPLSAATGIFVGGGTFILNDGKLTNLAGDINNNAASSIDVTGVMEVSGWLENEGNVVIGQAGKVTIFSGGVWTNNKLPDPLSNNDERRTGLVSVGGVLAMGEESAGPALLTVRGRLTSVSGSIGGAGGDENLPDASVEIDGGVWTILGQGHATPNAGVLLIGGSGKSALSITNGGSLTTDWLIAGSSSPGGDTTISVSGNGSLLSVRERMDIGEFGRGELTIDFAGRAFSGTANIASTSESTGSVRVVTGRWDIAEDLDVGALGYGTLTIENFGVVSAYNNYIGTGTEGNGVATVTGGGSVWNSENLLIIGNRGTGELIIEKAASVTTGGNGALGDFSSGVGTVTVMNPGSTWEVDSILAVGNYGTGAMSVVDAGRVSSRIGAIGGNAGSSGIVLVSGVSSRWAVESSLFVGGYGDGVLNITHGGEVTSGIGYVGGEAGATGYVGIVGEDARWNTGEALYVGGFGTGTVLVSDGGGLYGASGYIGGGANSQGAVTISGDGSKWVVENDVQIGVGGAGSLTIENGGYVSNLAGELALLPGSFGTATVTGAGSRWEMAHWLTVGVSGTGALTIADGGVVDTFDAFIGESAEGVGTTTVTGAGSQWMIENNLTVGVAGRGTLRIESGGIVTNVTGIIGNDVGSRGEVVVSGAGSLWTNTAELVVGLEGAGTLRIENGAEVFSPSGSVGASGESSSSSATVTGAGSFWSGEVIGVNSGTLVIEAGGRVTSDFGFVGSEFGQATVTGVDSVWSAGAMGVIGGRLLIENAGRVESQPGFIEEGGLATVTGEGSLWSTSEMSVSGGKLRIEAGGRITSFNGDVGNFGGQGLATVTGQGSQWVNDNELYVGKQGTGSLRIESGGQVTSTAGGIGFSADSIGSATVTGAGSKWTNSDTLTVGFDGRGLLEIDNGGSVSNVSSAIGWNEGSEGHATVFGPESIWTNSNTLLVGVRGTGFLTVGGSATVVSGMDAFTGVSIGVESGSNGAVTVTDSGSTWTAAAANIIVGDSGTGVLTIANGARAASGWGLAGLSGGGIGSVTVTGSGSLWAVENWVNFGVGGSAAILIENGGHLATNDGHLALGQDSFAQVTVTGEDSQWTSREDLFIGGNSAVSRGTAMFTVTEGGHLEVGRQLKLWEFGTLTLNGGSITTHSFDRGVGVFNHIDGVLTINGGHYAQADTTLLIDGAGLPVFVLDNKPTTTPIEEVQIGAVNQGRLEIRNGSVIANEGDAFLGVAAGSAGSALVTNAGSVWTNGDRLIVGDAGAGVLRVEAGAEVLNEAGYIARRSDSAGVVEVVGGGAKWTNSGSLYVGGSASTAGGAASLRAASGGQVSVGESMTVWNEGKLDVQNGGTIEVASTLSNAGLIEIATGGRISAASVSNTGIMTNHGTLVGHVTVGAGGELSGSGIFNGGVTIADGGTFSPGASPGFSSMSQTVWDAGGNYLWEINALSGAGGRAGQDPGWDLWDTGDLTIGGPFTIALQSLTSENTAGLLAGWNPLLDQQWQIATSLNGAFSSLSLLLLDTARFLNPLLGGSFSLSASASGNELFLNYATSGETVVPLPSNLVHLAFLGLVVCAYFARRGKTLLAAGSCGEASRRIES